MMAIPYVEVAYTLQCAHCGREEIQRSVMTGQSSARCGPSLPDGWHVYDGRLICERHAVELVVRNRVQWYQV